MLLINCPFIEYDLMLALSISKMVYKGDVIIKEAFKGKGL